MFAIVGYTRRRRRNRDRQKHKPTNDSKLHIVDVQKSVGCALRPFGIPSHHGGAAAGVVGFSRCPPPNQSGTLDGVSAQDAAYGFGVSGAKVQPGSLSDEWFSDTVSGVDWAAATECGAPELQGFLDE